MRPSDILNAKRPELRRLIASYGVLQPRVFGSVLIGKDTEASDLDLLVEPSPSTTLFTLAGLQDAAEALLGFPVSILTPMSLPSSFRAQVLAEAQAL